MSLADVRQNSRINLDEKYGHIRAADFLFDVKIKYHAEPEGGNVVHRCIVYNPLGLSDEEIAQSIREDRDVRVTLEQSINETLGYMPNRKHIGPIENVRKYDPLTDKLPKNKYRPTIVHIPLKTDPYDYWHWILQLTDLQRNDKLPKMPALL
jgi:hypothetical protein